MSDEPEPADTPSTPPPAATPGGTATSPPAPPPPPPSSLSGSQPPLPAEAKSPAGQTPPPPRPPGPPIDYAMPAHKSYLPSPALIKNLGCIFKMLFGFTVLLCLGYFALMALNPKARQWALQGTKPGGKAGAGGGPAAGHGPTPFKIVNQVLAIPAQALGKTDDVVKANNARVGQLDGVIADEEGKTRKGKGRGPVTDPFASSAPAAGPSARGAGTATETTTEPASVSREALIAMSEKLSQLPDQSPASGSDAAAPLTPVTPPPAPKEPSAPAQVKLPGGIIISNASPAGTPPAGQSFLYWVVRLNISGVFQSSPPRFLMNNRLVYEGDEINFTLGIVFDHLDPANKLLVFRDKTGALVTRSY